MDFMDWLTRRLLGSGEKELVDESIPEEIDRLQQELLLAAESFEDFDWVPVRAFMNGVAAQQGYLMTWEEQLQLPEWETAGWFRERVRQNLISLARS